MSPILTLQRQLREIGRIRLGVVDRSGAKARPASIDTFRLTSTARHLIAAAADLYGGDVEPWAEDQWQVTTKATMLDVVIPPGEAASSWFELWTAAGAERRCDGIRESISGSPCLCPADVGARVEAAKAGEACRPTTRLRVILPALPDLGVWRLESHGYYAAVELVGASEVLARATDAGRLIPARLRIDHRTRKRPGQPLNRYAVPVLELAPDTRLLDVADLYSLTAGVEDRPTVPRLGAGGRAPEHPATDPPATSDLRGPAAPELSEVELKHALVELAVPVLEARLIADEAYGPGPLSGAQRYDLVARLRARQDSAR